MDNIKSAKKVFALFTTFLYLKMLRKTIEDMDDFDLLAFKGYHMRGKKEFFDKFFTDDRWDEINGIQKTITNDYTDYSKEVYSEKSETILANNREANNILFREGARLILFEEDDALNKLVSFMSEQFPDSLDNQWNLAIGIKNEKIKLTQKEAEDFKRRLNDEASLSEIVKQWIECTSLFSESIDQNIITHDEFRNYVKVLSLETAEHFLKES